MPSRERIASILERRKVYQERNKAHKSNNSSNATVNASSSTNSTSFASNSSCVVPEPISVAVPTAAPIKGVLKNSSSSIASAINGARKQLVEMDLSESEDDIYANDKDKHSSDQEEDTNVDEFDKHYQNNLKTMPQSEERDNVYEQRREERNEAVSEPQHLLKRPRGRPPSSSKPKDARDEREPRQAKEPKEAKEVISQEPKLRGMTSLLKHSGVGGSTGPEVISASHQICEEIIENALDLIKAFGKEFITGEHVMNIINKHFNEGEKDLIEESFISPQSFNQMLASKLTKINYKIKRDAVYILQLYTESYLLKLISAADLIASSSKRARINATDLSIAFHIRNL